MDSLLHWTPVFWALRVAVFVVIVDCLGLFALVTARFFRWKHMKRLILAELPEVRRLGGQVAGAGATVELAEARDGQFVLLERRLDELQSQLNILMRKREDVEEKHHGPAEA